MTRVGFIGLGNMGRALAGRLLDAYPLSVFDLDPSLAARMAERGAEPHVSARALAERSDVVCTCLPSSVDVRRVLIDDGVAEALKPGSLIVDFTSGTPTVSVALAAELHRRCISFVDAPVSGGPQAAEAGTIAIMVGADRDTLETVENFLQPISLNVVHVGAVGSGHCVKLLNNLLAAGHRLLAFQAATVAASQGVDPETFIDVVNRSSGRSYATEVTFPRHVFGTELRQNFSLGLMEKDVNLACLLFEPHLLAGSMAHTARQLLVDALELLGPGDDINELLRLYESAAKLAIAHQPPGP